MIRGLLIGIARIIFWMIALYLISAVVQTVRKAFSRNRSRSNQPASASDSQKGEKTSKGTIEYNDVRDATFTELHDDSAKKPSAQ